MLPEFGAEQTPDAMSVIGLPEASSLIALAMWSHISRRRTSFDRPILCPRNTAPGSSLPHDLGDQRPRCARSRSRPRGPQSDGQTENLMAALAALIPPRQHYQQYLSTREANEDLWRPPQGLHTFLRAFFHVKSADWAGNKPHPLNGRAAADLAKMPAYYVMELGKTMPATVTPCRPSAADIQACR